MDSSLDKAVVRLPGERISTAMRWTLLIALIVICYPALGEEPLSLVTGEKYPPFTGSDLQDGGVITALVSHAYARNNVATQVDFKPWVRGYEDSLKLQYDATFPYISTAEREANFLFSDPLYMLEMRLYVEPESRWREGSPAELSGAVFCLPVGYEFAGWVSEQREELTFVRPRTIEQCHEMMLRDRVDVLISNPANVAYLATLARSKSRHVTLRELPAPLADVTLHLMIPAHHPQATRMLDSFNDGLRQMRSSGDFDRLFAAHPDYQVVRSHAER